MPILALLLAAAAPTGSAPSTPVHVDGAPEIQGALSVDDVKAGVKAGMGAVSTCYADALDDAPALAGRVVVEFTVLPDGSVLSATTRSSTVNQFRFEACVNRAYMDMAFAAPRGGKPAVVRSALRFTPPASAPLASSE